MPADRRGDIGIGQVAAPDAEGARFGEAGQINICVAQQWLTRGQTVATEAAFAVRFRRDGNWRGIGARCGVPCMRPRLGREIAQHVLTGRADGSAALARSRHGGIGRRTAGEVDQGSGAADEVIGSDGGNRRSALAFGQLHVHDH